MHNLLYHLPKFVSSSFCIHLSIIRIVKSVLPPVAMRGIVALSLFNKGTLVRLPAPAHRSPLFPGLAYYVSERSLDKPRVNEDICFHSGSAGTCPLLPQLSETISSHLLAADCSGRFLLLVSPSTPPSGLWKVLHRSSCCVENPPARSDMEGEKIGTERKQILRGADSLFSYLSLILYFCLNI